MPSVTVTFATITDVTGVGTVTWSNPGNAATSNDVRATAILNASTSHYLQAVGGSGGVPAGATILGVECKVERSVSTAAANLHDNRIRMVVGASITATDKADSVTAWPATEAVKTYGGPTDLWSQTLTPSVINAADWGFVVSAVKTDAPSSTARVDQISAVVYYSITFTDSGTATVTLSGTGTDSKTYTGSGTATLTLTGTGTESRSNADSGTATFSLTGTGTDSRTGADSGTATLTLSGTGSESHVHSGSGSATLNITGTGGDAVTFTDSGADSVTLTGSGTDSLARTATATGTVTLTGTGHDTKTYTDARTVQITISGTGTGTSQHTATGTLVLTISGAGSEDFNAPTISFGQLPDRWFPDTALVGIASSSPAVIGIARPPGRFES